MQIVIDRSIDSMLEPEEEPSIPLAEKQRAMTQSSMLTTIKRSEVPHYLRKSELYLSFSDDETDDEISVPYSCMKMDLEFKGLEHLLLTMRFWIKKYFPDEAIAFMLKSQSLKTKVLLRKHQQEHPKVDWLLGNVRARKEADKCSECCRFGRLDFLHYFVRLGMPVSTDTLATAANNGHLECLKYVYKYLKSEKILPDCWRYVDVREAASAGQVDCLQYLLQAGLPADVCFCASAAAKDQLAVLKLFLAHVGNKLQYNELCELFVAAAQGQSGNCLEYLLETFPTKIPVDETLKAACLAHNTCTLRLLIDRELVSPIIAVLTAAKMGSVKCTSFLRAMSF